MLNSTFSLGCKTNHILAHQCACSEYSVTIVSLQEPDPGVDEFDLEVISSHSIALYQWQVLIADVWTSIEGATSSTYNTGELAADTYEYRVVVADLFGCEQISETFVLEVVECTVQVFDIAEDNEICDGGFTTFFSEVLECDGSVTYQWQTSPDNAIWTDIPGATSDTYISPILTVADSGRWWRIQATCSNGCVAVSDGEVITVNEDPIVNIAFESGLFCDGGFDVLHSEIIGGAGGNVYQWQQFIDGNWEDIVGANGADYMTDPLTTGEYDFRLIVTQDSGCSTTSALLTLVVEDDPIVTIEADDETISAGGSFTLTSDVVGGAGGNTYQWQWLDGVTWTDIFFANSDTFTNVGSTLPNGDPIIVGTYTLRLIVIQNSGCESFSNEITITVT